MDGIVAPAPRSRLALPRRSLRTAGDERLVAQIRGGDGPDARTAFEVLYDRHHRGVLAFCRHMLGSPEEAEDAVQHTFSSAYRALLADDREIALRAWLYAIARNRCLSMLAARREQVALDDVEAVLPSTSGLAAEVEQRNDLREMLADMQRLPVDQRAALVLSELEAHSHKEIADILAVPPSKVKALVFQARESLMIRRQARDTDCTQIREQLSVLRGGALRRRELRRHVESCEGCRMFEAEVRHQRAGMALLLPVAPTLGLKHGTLASAFAAGGTSAAAVATVASGAAAGGLALGTKAMAAKALAILAVAGTAGGGGYVAVDAARDSAASPSPQTQREGGAAQPAPAAVSPAATPAEPAQPSGAAPSEQATAKSSNAAAGVTGAERATDRSDGRSGGTASDGRSTAARERAAERRAAAARRRDAASRAAEARREDAAARVQAQRQAAAERRARALEEAAAKRRAAEAGQRAKEKPAVTPPAAASPATPAVPAAPVVPEAGGHPLAPGARGR